MVIGKKVERTTARFHGDTLATKIVISGELPPSGGIIFQDTPTIHCETGAYFRNNSFATAIVKIFCRRIAIAKSNIRQAILIVVSQGIGNARLPV